AAPRRLGRASGAEPRRLLRGMSAHDYRLRHPRPPLVPRQSSACLCAASAGTALDFPSASDDRHRHLRDLAALAVVLAGWNSNFVASAIHSPGVLSLGRDVVSAMAGAGPGACGLCIRCQHGALGAAEAAWLLGGAAAESDAARHGRRDKRICERRYRDGDLGADRAGDDADAVLRRL